MSVAPRIFISLASYRDPDCHPTVSDLFAKASAPDRIRVGLCWQFIAPDDDDMFAPLARPAQVRCVGYDARQSLGPCWAKRQAQRLWRGEEYVLQVDSHMRFAPAWDVALIEMLGMCPSSKPVLSTYPAPYDDPDHLVPATPHLVAEAFDASTGLLHLGGQIREMEQPQRGAFIGGSFCFARSSFLKEVPYDPKLYFYGEEISLSVRAWTHGWDVFTPHRCVIYHQYDRPSVPRHWDDHAEWWRHDVRAVARVRRLLGWSAVDDTAARTGGGAPYGLGRVRRLSEFERFTGVSFSDQRVSARAREGTFTPPARGRRRVNAV